MFNSFKGKVLFVVIGTIVVFAIMTIVLLTERITEEFIIISEENVNNVVESTKKNVESQYKSILHHRAGMLERRKIELENNILIVFSLINHIYDAYYVGDISEEDAKIEVMETLKDLRYDNEVGYFWINDVTKPYPIMIMHPTSPELDGKSMDDEKYFVTKGNNENLFVSFVEIVRLQNSGYVEYLWEKPLENGLSEVQPKISYVKLFEPWEWVIGTGLYIDDIEKNVESRILIAIDDLNKILKNHKNISGSEYFIFDDNQKILIHHYLDGIDGSSLINPDTGTFLLNDLMNVAFKDDNFLEYKWNKEEDLENYTYAIKTYVTYFEPLGWYIASSYYKDDFKKKVYNITNRFILYTIFFLIIGVIISFLRVRNLLKPLNNLITSIKERNENSLPEYLDIKGGTQEINLLQDTINDMLLSVEDFKTEIIKTHKKLQYILDSATLVSIISTDSDGLIDIFNSGAERMLGYDASSVVGMEYLKLVHDELEINKQKEKLKNNFDKNFSGLNMFIEIANNKIYEENHWTYIKKNGDRIIVNLSMTKIYDRFGKLTGYLGVAMDITERIEAGNDLKNRTIELNDVVKTLKYQEEKLEELVVKRTLELENSIKVLKETQNKLIESEKMASLGGLVAGVAHEINTPVGMGITVASSLIFKISKFRELVDNNKLTKTELNKFCELVEESSEMIFKNLNRTATLVENFKLIATDQFNDTRKMIHVKGFISEIFNTWNEEFLEKNIKFKIACKEDIIINSYPKSFRQIIVNLISNSLSHGFDNSSKGFILISIKKVEDSILLEYEDDGIGMKKNEISKIFEPFYTTKRGKGGTGLGLNIVYNIIMQKFNGTIDCSSEYDKFTKFIIKFPI